MIYAALARLRARTLSTVVLTALVAAVVVPVATAPAVQAASATGGTARFPGVEWITWGDADEALIPDASGEITTTETIDLGDQEIVVTCTLSDVQRTRGSGAESAGLLRAYSSGSWRGDGLDDLYNVGGTESANQLVSGIANNHDGNTVDFDFACDAVLNQGASSTPVDLAGLVMASAESSIYSGSHHEYVGATITSDGTWRVIDRIRGGSCTNDLYARHTSAAGTKTLRLYGALNTNCEGSNAALRPNPTAVAFMDGVSEATDVTLAGRGTEAIALGVMFDLDFGDAPASYGAAGALNQTGFTGGEPVAYVSGNGQSIFGMTLADQSQQALRLGSAVDFEAAPQYSADALGDDAQATDDEDGVTLPANLTVTPGASLTVPGVTCHATASQTGVVAGWLDFDADGVFDASERSAVETCPVGGGTVALTFSVPSDVPALAAQPTFLRLRVAPTAAELTPTGVATGGEVEDYAFTAQWPETPALDLDKVATGGTVEDGQPLTFTLTVTNTGNMPLTDIAVADPTATVSGCSWSSLAPDESRTCTATYDVTAADVAAGFVTNTASATATELADPVAASATVEAAIAASPDTDTTTSETTLTRGSATGVLVNDQGRDLTVTSHDAVPASEGSLTINADGSYVFTPASGFSGTVTAGYAIEDLSGDTDSSTLTITVTPTAADDAASTAVNTPVTVPEAGLTGNDQGTDLDVASITQPSSGSAVLQGDGSVVYTPAAGFSGTDAFTYTVEDAEGQQATATVTVTVSPAAGDDTASTPVNTPVTVAEAVLIGNDSGASLDVASITQPSGGSAVLQADGSVEYTPAAGFTGTDTFTYTVEDAEGQQATATVTVTVTPTAANDAAATGHGVTVTRSAATGLLANDGGSTLAVTGHTPVDPSEGSLTINADGSYTFTPASGFSGVVTSTYTAEDAEGQAVTATLTITVGIDAVDDADTTAAETTLTRDASAGVLDNDGGSSLTVTGHDLISPAEGTLAIATDGSYTFTPAAGFSGPVTADYTVEDADGQTATATLTIDVTPVAVDDSFTTPSGTTLSLEIADLIGDDLGSGVTLDAVGAATGGTAEIVLGQVVFTPAPGFSGEASFTYDILDEHDQPATATVTVAVGIGAVDDTDTTAAEATLTRDASAGVLQNDAGSSLSVTTHDSVPAGQGALTINADGSYSFTPAAGFSGEVTADYTVRDADGQEATATLTIDVTPVANDDSASTQAGTPVTVAESSLIANDLGSGLSAVSISQPTDGSAVLHGDGSVEYTPATGFSGTDTFTYTVEDAEGQQSTASVTVDVSPTAVDDVDSTSFETPVTRDAAAGVLANDAGTGLSVTGHTAVDPSEGSLSINPDGSYVLVPAAGFSGIVASTYTVEDADGLTATATLTIAVGIDASDDAATTAAQVALARSAAAGVLANDGGTGLTVTSHDSVPASQGSLTINADGSYAFTPADGFSGVATADYTVTDTDGQTATATLAITVTPTAGDDSATTDAGVPVMVSAGDLIDDDLGSDLSVVSITQPGNGTAVLQGDGSVEYTSAAGFSGTDTFTYTVEDADGQQATATVTLTVLPVGTADAVSTTVGTPVTVASSVLLGNDAGAGLAIVSTTDGAHGTVALEPDGGVTYAPEPGFSGTDTYTYDAQDAEGQPITVEVTVTVDPQATDDSATTAGGTPVTRDASQGVLLNDAGTGLTVVGHDPVDPSRGELTIEPDGGYTFTPVQGFVGTVTVEYTVRDAEGQQATASLTIIVEEELPLVAEAIASICIADSPYLDYAVTLPEGFPDQGAAPLTITFVNPDGEDYVVTNLALSGRLLWPGAADGAVKQWPGYQLLDDGTYVATDGNFAWTREGVEVRFEVNPEYSVTVQYPPATSACASPAQEADGASGGPGTAGGALSSTGATVLPLALVAAVTALMGLLLLLVARRRRD
ncbi:CshA/CshB family fibrillar adhesin-related protein [uncultured Demequina sp.]|uniref:CshA/CshB family fibrillar adhesin-related protein n=1 Tax=uncultured Demequina sp. TaxID=693499 RepID=UPI0025EEC81E|nr:CshA/CshB family fibrillar adhesin-related protein [uncultured Demequina sp.]